MYESNQYVINVLNENLKNMEATSNNSNVVYQLRVYELNDHNKEQFLVRFRDHASRIMKRHGFNILNMWVTNFKGKPEFIYLLKWDSEVALKKGWDKFFTDKEWIEIRERTTKEYGMLVADRKENRILQNAGF